MHMFAGTRLGRPQVAPNSSIGPLFKAYFQVNDNIALFFNSKKRFFL